MQEYDLTEHDNFMRDALLLAGKLDKKNVVDAFVQSLVTRDLPSRSALGSYAHIWAFKEHEFKRIDGMYSPFCTYCGINVSDSYSRRLQSYEVERTKWGGVRHDEIPYAVFDLSLFAEQGPVDAESAAWDSLKQILDACKLSRNIGELHKAVGKIIKGNKNERSVLFEILAYCGVLCPSDCPSYMQGFVPFERRGDGDPCGDRRYPFSFWRGAQINEAAVEWWFGDFASSH